MSVRCLGLAVLALALALAAAPRLAAEVVHLVNGDRVSGKVVGSVARRVRLQTPYGTLVIPRQQVDRIEHDDGRVEVMNPPPPPPPVATPTPPPQPVRLQLALSGDTFWHAWEKRAAPLDPSLRLELRLDDAPLVSYTDGVLDPEDLPRAIVNSFVFAPENLHVLAAEGVVVSPPIVAGGQIGLALELPGWLAGEHRLRAAYRLNDGSPGSPHWRDTAGGSLELVLRAGETVRLHVEQSRGAMEFAHRRMQGVSTFLVALRLEGGAAAP